MRQKGYTFILALLYVLVIPWYLPHTELRFYGFPLWIWIIVAIHIGIAGIVSLYLLTDKNLEESPHSSRQEGNTDD